MIKIEAATLKDAYEDAASTLQCSVTELTIEVVQAPSKGILGLFKKSAIIVAVVKNEQTSPVEEVIEAKEEIKPQNKTNRELKESKSETKKTKPKAKKQQAKKAKEESSHTIFNDTIMPESFVSTQDDEDYNMDDINFTADYEEESDEDAEAEVRESMAKIASDVQTEINALFNLTCFAIDTIDVTPYDDNTLLVEFKGEDAALLIGKEGYRYKALSYMIFNWLNAKYQVQLRLEIAEFLKNQEESVTRYLIGVCEGIDRDGRAQTKILDGVLVQIALRELRDKYPDKYVAIRSTRDGLKYIIVNDYHN